MLKNLLKVEWRSSGRLLLIVDAGVLGITILASLFMALGANFPVLGSQNWFTLLTALLMFATVMGIIAMMLVCFFANARSFYRLLGQEGYLMMTLPVSADQHIAAKLLYAMGSTIASCLFLSLEMNLLTLSNGEGFATIKANGEVGAVLYGLLLMLLAMAGSYLYCYLCIALAGRWPQQRLVAAVLIFFGLQFILQIVGIFVLFGFAASTALFSGLMSIIVNAPFAVGLAMLLVALLIVAWDVVLWLIIRSHMTKKLNLA